MNNKIRNIANGFLINVFIVAVFFGTTSVGDKNSGPKMPMRYDFKETAEYRWLQKPVLDSILLDDMENPDNWSANGEGEISFTRERFIDGKQSVRLRVTPAEIDTSGGGRASLRFRFGGGSLVRSFNGEDWRKYNRLSFWIYPTYPGFHTTALSISIDNNGSTKAPNMYEREKSENIVMEPDKWNHIVWEIDDLPRDKINAVLFTCTPSGKGEKESGKTVWLDIDHFELQKVEPDNYEGWNIPPGKISFSHTGYQIGLSKNAIASKIDASEFKIINEENGKAIHTKPIQTVKTHLGQFQVMDFSEIREAGTYFIEAGNTRTRSFKIDDDVWRETIWKTINFFYCERCGTEIPGIHSSCHGDLFSVHGDRSIIVNGGWHDAGDLSQVPRRTAEATYAMFGLAEKIKTSDPVLYERLIEEARWGLDWIIKTRFGDGYRPVMSVTGEWTDGIIGTFDDRKYKAQNTPFDNFIASAAEALAGKSLKEIDLIFSNVCIKTAKEDWEFAINGIKKPDVEISGIGAIASTDLYEVTGEKKYLDKAIEFADVIINSQQRTIPDWDIPLTGFFYSDIEKTQILRYNPCSQEHAPMIALGRLCELDPNNPLWIKWYSAIVLYSEYIKNVSKFTEPYGMIPCSIYKIDESLASRYYEDEKTQPQYKEQVLNGIKLGKDYYLRLFPVWYSHRGNHGIILSQAKAVSVAAHLRNNAELANISQLQLEWIIGRNPFCQSTMFGEGYDFAPQYTPTSGHMVGSLPVGIETKGNSDLPYWPPAINWNYKEVWVHPASRWLWVLQDLNGPAEVSGIVTAGKDDTIEFQEATTGKIIKVNVDKNTGCFKTYLSEGNYIVTYSGGSKKITALPTGIYNLDLRKFLDFAVSEETLKNGSVTIKIKVNGNSRTKFAIRADNLIITEPEKEIEPTETTLLWKGKIISRNEQWTAVIIPDGNLSERKEIIGSIKK